MSIYDPEDIKDREGRAASGAPSSTGHAQHDSDTDGDNAKGGGHASDEGQGLARQLQQQEKQSASAGMAGIAGGLGSIPLSGGMGSALKTLGKFLWKNNRRKAATVGAGSSAMVVLGLIWVVNFSAGPLAFIHIGEILDKNFVPERGQTEKRVNKLFFQMLFKPPEDVQNPIGDNRLSFLGYLMKNRTLNQLKAKGITPQLKSDGFSFDGFTIDPKNGDSPFYEKYFSKGSYDDFRVLDSIKSELDPAGKLKLKVTASEGKVFVQGNETWFSNSGIKAMSDVLTTGDHPVFDPVWDYIRVRNLSRWNIAGNFHWLSKLDAKVTASKDAFLQKYLYDPIKKGLNGNSADGVDVQTTDSNGNPVETPLEGGEGPLTEVAAKSFLTDPKSFASVAGGIAAAAAIICTLKVINEAVGLIRWAQVDRPMMTQASIPLSIHSQIQSGQDLDNNELNDVATSTFNTYDKNGNVKDTWYDGMALRATAGGSGGIDMAQGLKDIIRQNDVPWLDWTTSDAVKTLCSGPVTILLTGIGIGLMFVPGVNVINAAIGAAVFTGLSVGAATFLPRLIAGQGINPKATGAEWANNIAYGSRMLANQHAVAQGGVALTTSQENQLFAEANARDREQFHSETLADRLFNANDYRSIVGNMIDNAGVYNTQDLFAKVGSIPNIIGSLFSLPASIFSATVHAASPYQYPFPMIGFSDADVDSSIVSQPFDNADKVNTILDNEESSGDHTYIDKALNCFGVAITKGDHGWQAVPTTASGTDGQDHTFGPDPYDASHYNQGDCISEGDTNWLRVRMWIFDLSNMEGYACSQGDEASCENSGFNTASNTGLSGDGVKFVSQNDPQWANTKIWALDEKGNPTTMSQEGCVLAVESMVITTLTGNFVSPVVLNDKYGGDNDPYNNYGLKATGMWVPNTKATQAITPATQESMQKVISTLKSGGLVAVYAKNDGTQPFWSTPGHEELIRGITADGKLLVYDPWDMPDSTNHFIPDASYPNDPGKHSMNAYPQSNFIQPGVSFDFITKGI